MLCLDEDQVSPQDRRQIATLFPDFQLVISRQPETISQVIVNVEIVGGWFPHDQVLDAPRLKWIQQWSAGADWILKRPEMRQSDVIVTTASGIHAIQITEHIFSFMFAFARSLPVARLIQLEATWINLANNPSVFELFEKKLLVVGVGAIGSRTAAVGKALGMRVIGVRRNPQRSDPSVEQMFGPDQLDQALPEADFVAVVTPLTNETRGMIGSKELDAMKKSAFIINVGRGAVIDEGALILALQKGQIAGAGLDTFEVEPLPDSSPLWRMDNVIITCHYAGFSPRYHERAMVLFLDNLGRYAAGRPLQNVVKANLGY